VPILHNSATSIQGQSRPVFPLTLRPSQTTRAAQVQALLQTRAAQFAATGEAAYICHRAEIGIPGTFLRCARRLVGPQVRAWWYHTPWPKQAPSNVLIVRHREVEA
jgi:hypothetical protein